MEKIFYESTNICEFVRISANKRVRSASISASAQLFSLIVVVHFIITSAYLATVCSLFAIVWSQVNLIGAHR